MQYNKLLIPDSKGGDEDECFYLQQQTSDIILNYLNPGPLFPSGEALKVAAIFHISRFRFPLLGYFYPSFFSSQFSFLLKTTVDPWTGLVYSQYFPP
jgi:hypothetical protein